MAVLNIFKKKKKEKEREKKEKTNMRKKHFKRKNNFTATRNILAFHSALFRQNR
jgi:ribosomal protein RSM22 (predicted rRNA methylase)